MSLKDTNPKYILLATDGEPNCAAGCAGNDCSTTPNPAEEMESEMAVADAAAAGIKVFVVGIGNVASAVAVLNQMAMNGGEAQTGGATSYYAATDQAALATALNQIVGKVASCTLPLPGKPQDPTNVIVEDEGDENPDSAGPNARRGLGLHRRVRHGDSALRNGLCQCHQRHLLERPDPGGLPRHADPDRFAGSAR